ncbi:MAG: hypothetical protein ACK57V_05635 [Pirellula sp.]|jgi:L-serine deaminase
MATADVNTIKLDSVQGVEVTGVAGAAGILPGMLVRPTAVSGVRPTFAVHNVAGGNGVLFLVLENRYYGDATSGGGVATAWTNGSDMEVEIPQPGSLRAFLLKASENVAIGDLLVSGGDGTFVKATAFSSGNPFRYYAQVLEASNVGTAQLIRARVL